MPACTARTHPNARAHTPAHARSVAQARRLHRRDGLGLLLAVPDQRVGAAPAAPRAAARDGQAGHLHPRARRRARDARAGERAHANLCAAPLLRPPRNIALGRGHGRTVRVRAPRDGRLDVGGRRVRAAVLRLLRGRRLPAHGGLRVPRAAARRGLAQRHRLGRVGAGQLPPRTEPRPGPGESGGGAREGAPLVCVLAPPTPRPSLPLSVPLPTLRARRRASTTSATACLRPSRS